MSEPTPRSPNPDAASNATRDVITTHAYWRANLKIIGLLLSVWFTVSFGFGILLVEPLNSIPFFGFKLGFWWAQQGSIYVFVMLIIVYVIWMHRIDQRFGVSDDDRSAD